MQIYARFQAEAKPFMSAAACAEGCAYCCRAAGRIDATTQEGLVIQTAIAQLPKSQRRAVEKRLRREVRQREQGHIVACPFLQKNDTCQIYPVRPFSCRRVYSLHRCREGAPPRLHRQVMALADAAIEALRQCDPNGYSGHLSYILHMLTEQRFRDIYLTGGFAPEAVMAFGRSHQISINRKMPVAGFPGRPPKEV